MASRFRILSRMFTPARNLCIKEFPIVKTVYENVKAHKVVSAAVGGLSLVVIYNTYVANKYHQKSNRKREEYCEMLTQMQAEIEERKKQP